MNKQQQLTECAMKYGAFVEPPIKEDIRYYELLARQELGLIPTNVSPHFFNYCMWLLTKDDAWKGQAK